MGGCHSITLDLKEFDVWFLGVVTLYSYHVIPDTVIVCNNKHDSSTSRCYEIFPSAPSASLLSSAWVDEGGGSTPVSEIKPLH